MFRPHEMRKIKIFGLHAQKEELFKTLHAQGVLQPVPLRHDLLERLTQDDDMHKASDALLRISHVVRILQLAPVKLPILQSVLGLETMDITQVKDQSMHIVLRDTHQFLQEHEQELLQCEATYNQCVQSLEHIKALRQICEVTREIDLPLHLLSHAQHIGYVLGRLAPQQVAALDKELKSETEDFYELKSKALTKKSVLFAILYEKSYQSQVQQLVKRYGAHLYHVPDVPPVEDIGAWLDKEQKEVLHKKKQVLTQLTGLRKKFLTTAITYREELEIIKERYHLLHDMSGSKNFFVIEGWIMKHKVNQVTKVLEQATDAHVIVETQDPKEDDNVPVELHNPKILKPFEVLTELYALPRYKDIDPTFVVGPVFLIYAAFMLTDAVYGFLLFILGLGMYTALARRQPGLKNMTYIIMGMGVLTTIFGVLTGSYFGDFPKYLGDSIFGVSTSSLAIWKDPLADPLYFLILSIGVALVHLNVGLFLGCMEDVRKKAWKDLISERIVWFVLQLGIVLYFVKVPFWSWVVGLAVLVIVLSKGPLGLLDITGFMGDVISYARLFALSLSTAGMALAVNLLADLLKTVPGVGIILALLIFLMGHAFGFVMNTIGSFVHALRLQFVEFFGKFYEGGGDRFSPYKEERVYTEVKP